MKDYLSLLLPFQRFFIPGLLFLLGWALWKLVFKKDRAVGLVLYLGLVVIVDAYMNTGLYLPGLEKGSIRYSEICAAILLFNGGPALPKRGFSRAVTALIWSYFALLFLSALRSDPLWTGLLDYRRLVLPQIVAFLVARRGLELPEESYRRFFLCLTTLVVIVAVFTFWDLFFDRMILKSDMLENGIYWFNRSKNRFGSFFLNPNFLAAFVVLVFPAMFVWALNERGLWRRVFAGVGMLSLAFSMVETQSRGPLLALGIAIVILVVGPCGGASRRRRVALLAFFVMILALVMPGSYDHALERFQEDSLAKEMSTENGRSRQTTWLYTGRIISDHPILGIGFGEAQFMKFMDAYGFGDEFGGESLDAPHNSYLQAAVYAGIPALLLFLLANIALLGRAAWVAMRGSAAVNTGIIFGMAVGLTGFLACVYTDLQLFAMSIAPAYWFFFGLLLSLVAPAVEAPALAQSIPGKSAAARATVGARPLRPQPAWSTLPTTPRANAPAMVLPPRRSVRVGPLR